MVELGDDEVAGGADGKILGEAFNKAKDNGLQDGHCACTCTLFSEKGQSQNEKADIKPRHRKKRLKTQRKTAIYSGRISRAAIAMDMKKALFFSAFIISIFNNLLTNHTCPFCTVTHP